MVTCVQLKQLCMHIQSRFTRILEHILKVIFFINKARELATIRSDLLIIRQICKPHMRKLKANVFS